MAPIIYSGSLQAKKKSELQDIAIALKISEQGTKDEIQARIKKHLDNNPKLEDTIAFAGLFGRRKRSVQPQSAPTSSDKPPSRLGTRRTLPLDPIDERGSPEDSEDTATVSRSPFAPRTPQSQRKVDLTTPSSLPPLPPSPAKSIIEHLTTPPDVGVIVEQIKQHEVVQNSQELLNSLRGWLSNSRNIWSLTSIIEFFYIIYSVVSWQTFQIPIPGKGQDGYSLPIYYPPLATFQESPFWLVLLHWALPTLLIPALVGNLVSFNPSRHPSSTSLGTTAAAPFDPLTASIVRLAANVAYPVSSLETYYRVDVLGFQTRVLTASVGLAFAFAEAIASAPQVFAKTLSAQERRAISFGDDEPLQSPSHPNRRALMAAGEVAVDDSEVD